MNDQNIICFAKDWEEDPTSNNHVMRLLARGNRVLWLNSIATRTPNLTKARDLAKIRGKLAAFARGPRQVDQNLWVYTPVVLPFPHNRTAIAINQWILRYTLARLRRRLGMRQFQLWTFLPSAVEYVGKLGESIAVYYCTDEYSQFSWVDGQKTSALDQALCRRADVVFATANSLRERRSRLNPETHLASHGVDYALFSKAISDQVPLAPDIASLPRPVLGFFGLVHEWIDLGLIEYLARRHPEWTIVMIGRVSADISRLAPYSNVHFLGRKRYEDLPSYCKAFSVGLIPFVINELTLNVNPIKLREYLSAGLPVVSTALPEVAHYRDWCAVAASYEEFERGVADALRNDTPELRRRRSELMKSETWDRKVELLGERVMDVQRRKVAGSVIG